MRRTYPGLLVVAVLLVASAATSIARMREPRYNSGPLRRSEGRVRVIEACRAQLEPGPFGVLQPVGLATIAVGNNPDPAANPPGIVDCDSDIGRYAYIRSPTTLALVPGGPSSTTPTEVAFSASLGNIRRKRLTLLVRPVSPVDPTLTVAVLDDTHRKLTASDANLRVIHALPSTAADGVRIGVVVGAVGAGCLTPPLSFGADAVMMLPAGRYTLAVFPSTDPGCSGEPLPDLTAMPVTLKPRTAYTAIAWVKQSSTCIDTRPILTCTEVDRVQLKMQRDFCHPVSCPINDHDGDGFPPR